MIFDGLAFEGTWRRYQRAALSAFEHDRASGRRTHLVAPPGSGKTLLGVEMIRRLGRRAVVLVPDGAVQMRWPRAVREFGAPAGTAGPEPAFPIACMTYDGLSPDRMAKLLAAQVGTVVLDEGHAFDGLGAVLEELGDVYLITLGSTPPEPGPATISIPAPAVVREGHLAPYLELAWLVEPVEAERQWLAEHPDRADDARVLLGRSAAKEPALAEVLAAEREARGGELRALVLCELEHATEPPVSLAGVLDPATGTARHALAAVGAAGLRPLMVGERGLCCLPADAEALLEAAVEQAERHLALPEWAAEPDGVLVSLRSHGAEWVPRAWIDVAARVLGAAGCDVLVGTGSLLGGGWRSSAVNCLVSLGPAGRPSLLPARGKVVSNWDVVCAVPGGGPDYERFARGRAHVFAPADDGELEAGPSHAHVELGPAPPPADRFAALNGASAERAADRDGVRERWRIGEAYRDEVLRTPAVRAAAGDAPCAPPPISQRIPLAAGLCGAAAFAVAAVATGVPALLAGLLLAPAGIAWAAARLGRANRRLPRALPLAPAARAVAAAVGESAVVITPRASGYVRCRLATATPKESERFASALGELLSAGPSQLQLTRPLPSPDGAAALLGRVLLRRPPFPLAHHAVPSELDPEVLARAWRRHVGPTAIVSGATPEAGYETLARDVWA